MMEMLVAVLAAYRLTRLVVDDHVTLPIRGRIIRWAYLRTDAREQLVDSSLWRAWDELGGEDDEAPGLAWWVKCYWCAGLWVSALCMVLWWQSPDVWFWVSRGLALSAGLVLVDRVESLLRVRATA